MSFLLEKCTLRKYTTQIIQSSSPFDCGNADLNDFFANDAVNYDCELLGKSYCFTLDDDKSEIVAAFTVANDSIKTLILPNSRKKKVISSIPREKLMRSYPAVMIGRLGVSERYRRLPNESSSVGDQLMDFIKSWFIDDRNKTGCRFIVVDSYNSSTPLNYYRRNGFKEMFSTEEQEKIVSGYPLDAKLITRLLYFDLIVLAR